MCPRNFDGVEIPYEIQVSGAISVFEMTFQLVDALKKWLMQVITKQRSVVKEKGAVGSEVKSWFKRGIVIMTLRGTA